MKYWKQGFYDAPQGDAVEITDEYYMELLDGQSDGFSIVENEDGYPILKSNAPSTIEEIKETKVSEINAYDKSSTVNEFTIQGISMWLNKETRTGLKLRFDAEKANGLTETSLWHGQIKITLNIEVAIGLLMQVEIYSSQCYDTTQQHIVNVMALATIEEIMAYDFTINYPEKLNICKQN